MSNPFVPQKHLTAIALGFTNSGFIADIVAPRTQVAEEKFAWTKFDTAESLTIPNTMVGRKGRVNQVEFTATEETDQVVDYGLEDAVPIADINAAKSNPALDPVGRATMKLSELVALDREKRVVDMVMNASSYGSNVEAVTGTDKWNDSASKPITQITDVIASMLVKPTHAVMGPNELLELRRNPQIVRAFNGSSGEDGLVPVQFIEQLFNIKIVVGDAYYNAARPGQSLQTEKLWGGGVSFQYHKPLAQLKDDMTFMLTAQYETKVAGSWDDKNIGLRGGKMIRTGESVKEVLLSKEAGFFLGSVI